MLVLDATNRDQMFDLMFSLVPLLRNCQYEKSFCRGCKESKNEANVGYHGLIDLGIEAEHILIDAIAKEQCSLVLAQNFARIFSKMFTGVTQLKCENTTYYQKQALSKLRLFAQAYTTEKHGQFVIVVLKQLISSKFSHDLSLAQASTPYNELLLLRLLFDAYEKCKDEDNMMNVGYLYIMYAVANNDEDSNVLHNIVFKMGNIQRDPKTPLQTPRDFLLNEMATINKEFSGFIIPDKIDYGYVLYTYFRIVNYYIRFPREHNNKIIEQILAETTSDLPRCLPFVLFSVDFCYKSIEAKVRSVVQQTTAPKILGKERLTLIKGAFKWVSYLNDAELYKAKLWPLLFNTSGSEYMDHISINIETDAMANLNYVRKSFLLFGKFYLALSNDQRDKFKYEYRYMMIEAVRVANVLLLRMYEDSAMEMFWLVYQLASISGDYDILAVTAVTHFLDNARAFQRLSVEGKPSLDALVSETFAKATNLLKTIDKLSTRKQEDLYCYLLSLALYHVANKRADDGRKLLRFVAMRKKQASTDYRLVSMKYDYVIMVLVDRFNWPHSKSTTELLFDVVTTCYQTRSYVIDAHASLLLICGLINYMTSFAYQRHTYSSDMDTMISTFARLLLCASMILRCASLQNDCLLLILAREKSDCEVSDDDYVYIPSIVPNERICCSKNSVCWTKSISI